MPALSPNFISHAWEVLLLFLIPVGGGIPAGVVLAHKYGMTWPILCALYFISDIILACVFEPLMLLFVWQSKRTPRLARLREAFAQSTRKMTGRYGLRPGPFSLVMITFGTDPMTGRSVSKAAGHGFFTGWILAILGDMLFFLILMVSTLWLDNVLGDGTWAAVIIMVAMIAVPAFVRRVRGKGEVDHRSLS